jgi:hypothetical protein
MDRITAAKTLREMHPFAHFASNCENLLEMMPLKIAN